MGALCRTEASAYKTGSSYCRGGKSRVGSREAWVSSSYSASAEESAMTSPARRLNRICLDVVVVAQQYTAYPC
jgi:hypothetical protein